MATMTEHEQTRFIERIATAMRECPDKRFAQSILLDWAATVALELDEHPKLALCELMLRTQEVFNARRHLRQALMNRSNR